jgi:hypothetical protein
VVVRRGKILNANFSCGNGFNMFTVFKGKPSISNNVFTKSDERTRKDGI